VSLSFRLRLVWLAVAVLGLAAVALSGGHTRPDPAGARTGAERSTVRCALVDGPSGESCWCPIHGPALVQQQLDAIAGIDREFADQHDDRARGIRERRERAREYCARLLRAMTSAEH